MHNQQKSGESQAYLKQISGISQSHISHISVIAHICPRQISRISHANLRHISGIYEPNLGDIFCKSYFTHLVVPRTCLLLNQQFPTLVSIFVSFKCLKKVISTVELRQTIKKTEHSEVVV